MEKQHFDSVWSAQIIEVIAVIYSHGAGTVESPVRRAVALFEKETGIKIADIDNIDSVYMRRPAFLSHSW